MRSSAWLLAYVLVVMLPLAAAAVVDPVVVRRAWRVEASAAIGFLALSTLTLQLALVARLGSASRALGSDALMQLHRRMGIVALALVLAHPLLLAGAAVGWRAWNPFAGGALFRAGAVALWVTLVVVVTSLARAGLRLRYEVWHAVHLAGAVAILAGSVAHVLLAGGYASHPLVRGVVMAYGAVALAIVVHYRLVRPWRLARHPWQVVSNDDAGSSTRLLRVAPVGHPGLTFEAGQFIWMATGRSPVFSQQHPLSIASSAAGPSAAGFELAIKALGDWSRDVVPALSRGARIWIDGPFGAFSPDRVPDARGFVLIAGGIGIAPMRAMLRTMRDRRDRRPVVLFYAASDPSRAVFADELATLENGLALRVIYVYEHPPDDWTGERGYVDEHMLKRHVLANLQVWHCFACGPLPMMSAVERSLRRLGVPSTRVHTERFQMV